MGQGVDKPDLSSLKAIQRLPDRVAPYWHTLEYCRHIGIQKQANRPIYWVARIRHRKGGYKQARLCAAIVDSEIVTCIDDAVGLAEAWFSSPAVASIAAMSYPVGITQVLRYEKSSGEFTVGDAMRDYVEWKRIAATRSHFETNLSLINHHIIPRLGNLPAAQLNSRVVTDFCRDVLQTPPKRGNQPLGQRLELDRLDPEALRKRKKTLNTLIGILRLALRIAWENGELNSERTWKSIRSLPNRDAPRRLFLSRTQCHALLVSCRTDLAKLVRGALYTGCRVSELARMEVEDVGAGVFGVYVRPSKNGRSRHVVLSKEGMSFVLGLVDGRLSSDLVFKMQTGRTWSGNLRSGCVWQERCCHRQSQRVAKPHLKLQY